MIHIHGVQSADQESEAYLIEFETAKLLVVQRMPLSTLQYFKAHCGEDEASGMQEESKYKDNLTYEILNGQMRFKGKTLFDLSYLNRLDLSGVSYILVCDYRDLLILPYLTRLKGSAVKVLLTVTMFNMGKLLLQRFFNRIQETDRNRQSLSEPNYFEESYAYQLFEQKYDRKADRWTAIYTESDMQHMLNSCIKLNFGQVFEECGIQMIPHSSGSSAATAMWLIQSNLTKQSLLFANNLSIHQWRHSLPAETKKLFNHRFTLVLGAKCVKESQLTSKQNFKTFIESVQSVMRSNKSCFVLIEDLLDILDLVDTLNMLLLSSMRLVYIYNPVFQHIIKYANSLVQYLNPYLKGKIYCESPEYPFSSYQALVAKGLFSFGSPEKVAADNKLPQKEQLIRYNPAIHFVLQSDNRLDPAKGIQFNHRQIVDRRPTEKQLKEWLQLINPVKICSFKKIGTIDHELIPFQSLHKISSTKFSYYKCSLPKGMKIGMFRLENNLLTEEQECKFMVISKNWRDILRTRLSKQQIVADIDSQSNRILKTEKSVVELDKYTFYLSSSNVSESTIIHKILMDISRKIKL